LSKEESEKFNKLIGNKKSSRKNWFIKSNKRN
jgi:hypothetical protein